MQDNPDQEWRRLTAHYGAMYDEELVELAAGFKDLTEIAQQVLRDEMKRRKLGDPAAPAPAQAPRPVEPEPVPLPPARFEAVPAPSLPVASEPVRPVGAEQEREWQRCKQHYAGLANEDLENIADEFEYLTPIAQQVLRDEMFSRGLDDPGETDDEALEWGEAGDDESNPLLAAAESEAQRAERNEWWVRMVETEDRDRARQYAIMLTNAGVDCRWYAAQSGMLLVEVAAAQAEQAEQVLAQPIPQSVIEQSKIEVPEFEMPRCPRCRSSDPVLLSTDPTNTWRCESCGHEWSDPVAEPQQA